MKQDIEKLMETRGVDALLVMGGTAGNPNLFYAVDGAGLTSAVFIKKKGTPAHLVHGPMERDQARATGIDTSTFVDNNLPRFVEEAGGDGAAAQAAFLTHLLSTQAIQGRVGVYGNGEVSRLYPVLRRLAGVPGVDLYEESNGRSLFEEARITKSEAEIERIRVVARSCFDAYDAIKAVIRGGRLVNGKLEDTTGPVTVGRLRAIVRKTFAEHGVVEDHDSIIAQGIDGTAPHNHGTDSDVLREGASIVVDIFPRESGGGYFFDITRTFCVGPAPDRLREVYAQVKEVLTSALAELKVGERCFQYQERACDRFEAMGYSTIRKNPRTIEGYVHGLGHGLGLDLHEAPRLGGTASNKDVLAPGMCFTVEPGLYLPDEEIAVRLEDVVFVRPDGTMDNLSAYPYDLEIFPAG